MTRDEKPTYNGWSNYETWAVNLWLSNEEGSYRYWTDRTRELVAECADGDAARSALSRLARELEESVHEECAIPKANLVADRTLYGYGLLSDAARVARYERQLAEAAGHIGRAEVDAAYDRVEARWRKKLGERLWAAVLNDQPALADEMFRAEDSD